MYGLYEFAYPYQYTLPCGGMARDEGLQAGILPFVPVLAAYDVRPAPSLLPAGAHHAVPGSWQRRGCSSAVRASRDLAESRVGERGVPFPSFPFPLPRASFFLFLFLHSPPYYIARTCVRKKDLRLLRLRLRFCERGRLSLRTFPPGGTRFPGGCRPCRCAGRC